MIRMNLKKKETKQINNKSWRHNRGFECVDIFSRRLDESDINFIPQIFAREKKNWAIHMYQFKIDVNYVHDLSMILTF